LTELKDKVPEAEGRKGGEEKGEDENITFQILCLTSPPEYIKNCLQYLSFDFSGNMFIFWIPSMIIQRCHPL